jgi:hypothetical protein
MHEQTDTASGFTHGRFSAKRARLATRLHAVLDLLDYSGHHASKLFPDGADGPSAIVAPRAPTAKRPQRPSHALSRRFILLETSECGLAYPWSFNLSRRRAGSVDVRSRRSAPVAATTASASNRVAIRGSFTWCAWSSRSCWSASRRSAPAPRSSGLCPHDERARPEPCHDPLLAVKTVLKISQLLALQSIDFRSPSSGRNFTRSP